MARIRHIALIVEDSEKTAAFYKAAFGMIEVFRHKNDETGDQAAIYLGDGYMNFALLPIDRPLGLNHIGFQVDDVEETLKTAIDAGAKPPSHILPRDGRQAETFVLDPLLGMKHDISTGWLTSPPRGAQSIEKTPV